MSNALPVVLTNLEFNATDLQRSDLSVHLDIVMGLNDGIQVRGVDTVIPGLEGVVPRSRILGARNVQLVGWLQPPGATEAVRLAAAQALLDELTTLFDPTMDPATLTGVARDGSTRSIDCRPETGPIFEEWDVLGVYRVSVSLIAADPTWDVAGS